MTRASIAIENCDGAVPVHAADRGEITSKRRGWMLAGGALLAAYASTCLLTVKGFTLREYLREIRSGVILSHADTREKLVAITFDDGPDPAYTRRVLGILKQRGIHATFFEQGRLIDRYPDITRQVVQEGHSIGNHTYTHPYLTRLTRSEIRKELEAGERSIEASVKMPSALFRPPRGEWNPDVFQEAVRSSNHIILWTVTLEHHDAVTPQEMANRVLRLVEPGDIVLMHDGAFVSRETTVQALPLVLDGLKERGYRCLTVPELLGIPGSSPVVAHTGNGAGPR